MPNSTAHRAYVAGPMRGYPNGNFDAFDDCAHYLRTVLELDVVSPAEMDRQLGITGADASREGFDGCADALTRDVAALVTCTDIVLLPGWEASAGAAFEVAAAAFLGLEVSYYNPDGPYGDRVHKRPFARPLPVEWFPATSTEVRIVDPSTGGAKGQKLAELGAVDPLALLAVAEVAGFGSKKYERYNFAKGYRWSLSFDAMMRHFMAAWAGEDIDPESGLPHLAHGTWHGLALLCFYLRGLGVDDRFPKAA